MGSRVLLVEDDPAIRLGVRRHLERHGFDVVAADSCESAREQFRACRPDAVLTDFQLPDGEALELISAFRVERPLVPIVVLTGYGSIELAVRAVRTGAHNFLTKPVDLDRLVDELRRACSPLDDSPPPPVSAPAGAARPCDIDGQIERLRDVDCTLLITGETGTGKTVLARRLHEASRRRRGPFVDLNCAGLARELVEAELFGYERGAFTSANTSKPGLFELADGGTLFLDEIGDIDLAVQPRILKAIEEKRFRRLGGVREISVDVRIVAATHRDLREAVKANAFRADLYYRLSTVTIAVAALRERRAEIPALVSAVIDSLAKKVGRPAPSLSADALAALTAHDWPGNIRELKNVLERAVHLTHGPTIAATDLEIQAEPRARAALPTGTLRDIEKQEIERALLDRGHVGDAAKCLGISRSTMYQKLREYGLSAPRRGRLAGGRGVS